ncbi:HD-GYP domain-containing protein [Candidatus Eisenbacteria bacterium]|uniref:HD-GYP domain-containing protein n=1 Tax=Eiseniibacteriota bacterium TaxID=2212470 RepID=A0ABV6YJN7_UNCEI
MDHERPVEEEGDVVWPRDTPEETAEDPQGNQEDCFPIPLSALQPDSITGFDVFFRPGIEDLHALFLKADIPVTEAHRQDLSEQGIQEVYVAKADSTRCMRYIEEGLAGIMADKALDGTKRAKILYDTAVQIVRDVMDEPFNDETITRAVALTDTLTTWLFDEPKHLAHIFGSLSFRNLIATHSVNVCILGSALGRRLGLSQDELKTLSTGLLLHDLGKSMIDEAILTKSGRPTEDEWEIIKSHPEKGVELLEHSEQLDPLSLTVIRQHHEKCSGNGYPAGLKAREIHSYAKIAMLVDVYDAMTTQRSYAQAIDAYPALRTMQSEMGPEVDSQLLRQFIFMLSTRTAKPARAAKGAPRRAA